MMDLLLSGAVDEAAREADGFLQGLAVGVVTDNKDPSSLARVRVRLPWQAEGDASYWARLAMPMAGPSRGTFFLPEIDDEVLVGSEYGDPSHLYVLGVLWNGKQKPPVNNDDGKNDLRLIHTRLGHRLLFNDGSEPSVTLSMSNGSSLLFNKEGALLDDGNGNTLRIESASGAITIKSSGSLTLKSDTTVSIEAGASMELKASGTMTVKGAIVQIN
jgi:uncharacterized protein involved in type VI secretion and phage assembly